MTALLPLLVAIPLGAAFVLPILEKTTGGSRICRVLAPSVSLILLGLVISLLGSSEATYWMGGWSMSKGAVGISLILDNLSRLMLLIVAIVTTSATFFSLRYMRRYTSEPLYYCLFFLMVTGMNGVIIAGDLFNTYVFLEVAAIASYALVAFGCGKEELEAAFKYLVLGTVGSTFILLGIAVVYNQTSQLNMALIHDYITKNIPELNTALLMAAAFFLMGFGLKAAMVPFHAWLPDAHPSAPAPISAMLSGVLIKALGVYALIRVFFNCMVMNYEMAYVLMALGIGSMVIGVFLAVGQWDFKRLLAYSSISQVGYVVLAAGIAGEMMIAKRTSVATLALLGGIFHLCNHAMFKSLLFLCSGAIEYASGTRLMQQLGGLKKRMPITGACLRIAALSISGVPPFNGFWSKLIIIMAVIQSGHLWLGAITVLVSFMTLLLFVKVQRHIIDGEPSTLVESAKEAPWSMCLGMIALAVICLGVGLIFPLLNDTLFANLDALFGKSMEAVTLLTGG